MARDPTSYLFDNSHLVTGLYQSRDVGIGRMIGDTRQWHALVLADRA